MASRGTLSYVSYKLQDRKSQLHQLHEDAWLVLILVNKGHAIIYLCFFVREEKKISVHVVLSCLNQPQMGFSRAKGSIHNNLNCLCFFVLFPKIFSAPRSERQNILRKNTELGFKLYN